MSDCALHDFDQFLCGQVVWNLRLHLEEPRIRQSIERLPAPLVALLTDDTGPNPMIAPLPSVVLHSEEILRMADAVRDRPIDLSRYWEPLTSYRLVTLCTGEIRNRLAPAEAVRWSEDSWRFQIALQQPSVELADGIELINDWTEELRHYLEALGEFRFLPRPDGQCPTPTRPEAGVIVVPELPELAYIPRMQAAIAKHEDGKHARPDELAKLAHANRQQARKALRLLEQQGEYCGFERATSTLKRPVDSSAPAGT